MNKTYTGNCHCGAIQLTLEFAKNVADIVPRACDCDYCCKQGAQYVSDPGGRVQVQCHDYDLLASYGSPGRMTRYLFCRRCGNLVGSEFSADGHQFMIVNGRLLQEFDQFPPAIQVTPSLGPLSEKIPNWQKHWFHEVKYI